MKICRTFLMLVFLTMLSACASSRKTTTGVSEVTRDNASSVARDSSTAAKMDAGMTLGVAVDSMAFSTSTKEQGNDEEMITEYVTEQVDASGNKTTTTDRTIKRKGSYDKQTDTRAEQRYREEQMAIYLSWLDSIVHSHAFTFQTHWAQNDSVSQQKDVNTKDTRTTSSWWKRAFYFLVVAVCVYFIIWLDNKKHKK